MGSSSEVEDVNDGKLDDVDEDMEEELFLVVIDRDVVVVSEVELACKS